MKKRVRNRPVPTRSGQKLPATAVSTGSAQAPGARPAPVPSVSLGIEPLASRLEVSLWKEFATEGAAGGIDCLSAAEPPSEPFGGRLMDPILREADLMRRLRPDSLAVGLRPDPQTEIILRLTQSREAIEAEASYERGDLESLISVWPELQCQLQLRGVRLRDLERPADLVDAEESRALVAAQDNLAYSTPGAVCAPSPMLSAGTTPMFTSL